MPIMEVRSARLRVRLGCSALERAQPQEVDLDVMVRFDDYPAACESDELKDTVCYAELIESARAVCEKREFKLIEKLANEIYRRLRYQVPPESDLWLRVIKLNPPIADLHGGVSFSIGDWPHAGYYPAPQAGSER